MFSSRPLALITGASSGIGATFARALSARGYDLILVARRQHRLEEVAKETGGEILIADLSDEAGLHRVEERIRTAGLRLLVNNAGYGISGPLATSDPMAQDHMHRLHINATLRLTLAALPGMIERRAGGIINVSSVAGFLTNPGAVSYCATKTWINSFTEGLWIELMAIDSPVRVQALCPGFTYSEFHDVAGMDRRKLAPRAWWLTAESVVEDSLRGLDSGRLFVIPSVRYKILVWIVNRIPRSWRRRLLLAVSRRSGRV
jgi:short-subunit dehydrogenase